MDQEPVVEGTESLGTQPQGYRSNWRPTIRHVRWDAADEMGLTLATLPEVCPWPVERVLDPDFWPKKEHDQVERVLRRLLASKRIAPSDVLAYHMDFVVQQAKRLVNEP